MEGVHQWRSKPTAVKDFIGMESQVAARTIFRAVTRLFLDAELCMKCGGLG